MIITILGSGTSTGVPTLGCKCKVCRSNDAKDKRLRCSTLLEVEGKRYLIDCGPDFRQQALRIGLDRIDALVVTHYHFDHIAGLDDLRFFPKFDLYSSSHAISSLHHNYRYIFSETNYVGAKPTINEHEVKPDENFLLPGGVETMPIYADHISTITMGIRIRNFAYLTDFKSISEKELNKLKNLDLLIMGVLRHDEHRSHLSLNEAFNILNIIKPKTCYFVHMSHGLGLHAEEEKKLTNVYPNYHYAYDGLKLELKDDGTLKVIG